MFTDNVALPKVFLAEQLYCPSSLKEVLPITTVDLSVVTPISTWDISGIDKSVQLQGPPIYIYILFV